MHVPTMYAALWQISVELDTTTLPLKQAGVYVITTAPAPSNTGLAPTQDWHLLIYNSAAALGVFVQVEHAIDRAAVRHDHALKP